MIACLFRHCMMRLNMMFLSSMMLGRSWGVLRWVCDDKSLTFGSFKAAAQGFM